MENGLVNLAAIVGLLIFSISLVPMILLKGTPKSGSQPKAD